MYYIHMGTLLPLEHFMHYIYIEKISNINSVGFYNIHRKKEMQKTVGYKQTLFSPPTSVIPVIFFFL